jgi:lipopolysaccharide/colanic/teichoic acid biosynthesis glycosyltransferase
METRRFRIFSLLADIIILTLAFLFMVWTKPASLRVYLPSHTPFFILLAILWLVVSLINGKMNRGKITNLRSLFIRVLTSNLVSLGLTSLIMYSFREYGYSRAIVLGTVLIATAAELIAGTLFLAFKKAIIQEPELTLGPRGEPMPSETEMVARTTKNGNGNGGPHPVDHELVDAIAAESDREMACSIAAMVGSKKGKPPVLLATGTIFNIKSLPREGNDYIINLRKLNRIKNPDEFLDAINSRLTTGGHLLCCVETKNSRKQKYLKRYPPVLNYIFYTFDFIFNRIMPKLRLTRGIYLMLTGGKNMVMSRAETLGRICRAGFRITQETFVGDTLCVEAVKRSEPSATLNHNYGLLIALRRIGRHGRSFKVYKLRTMHPYSEYIQDYVYSLHDLKEGGKFQHDFRITSWGRFCRKVWLDELPMLINFFKGDMKIVGVRPLSKQYFNLYSPEMRERRIKYRPGLLPPFYADMPTNLEEIQESERRYLDAYDKSPMSTDISYFFRSVFNIIFRHARSN